MNGNRLFHIARADAPAQFSERWVGSTVSWPEYVDLLDLDHPSDSKDCGGVFGGLLSGPNKTNAAVVSRSVVYLDADDNVSPMFVPDLMASLAGTAFCWHTTYSHTDAAPRYRVHIPASRDMSPFEVQAVTCAVMEGLGIRQFDLSCAQPSRMMYLPSAQNGGYASDSVDGDLLDVDAWQAVAERTGIVGRITQTRKLAHDLETDWPEGEPPTVDQKNKAWNILKKAAHEVEKETWQFGGRNNALIARLPTLYRLVLGGCLPAAEVDQMMWDAACAAPGDDTWTETEHGRVSANAHVYADRDGPGRPTVDDEADDFPADGVVVPTVIEAPLVPIEDLFEYSPARWTRKGGIAVAPLAWHINNQMPVGLDMLDRRLLVCRNGVWRSGEEEVAQAITEIFGDHWSEAKRNTVMAFIKDTAKTPRIAREPVETSLINCRNGMVRWSDGVVLPHDPSYRSTVQIPWGYSPSARCPAFDKFLSQVLPDQETIDFVWEVIGYLLFSGNPMHRMVLLWGPKGRNGKGTLLRVLHTLLGGQNVSSVDLHALATDKFKLAELYGRTANIAGDIDSTRMDKTALLKAVTGGDTLTADRKYGQPFDFTPWAVPVFSVNEMFTVNDSSEAFFARWLVVPFLNNFYDREDIDLLRKLLVDSEIEGVLAYGVRGLARLMSRGKFDRPQAVLDAGQDMARTSDGVRRWIDSHCVMDPDAWTPRRYLFASFQYSEDGGKMGRTKFYGRLPQVVGVELSQRGGVRGFRGIALRAVPDADA